MIFITVLLGSALLLLTGSALFFWIKDTAPRKERQVQKQGVNPGKKREASKAGHTLQKGEPRKTVSFCLPLARRLAKIFYHRNPALAGRWRDIVDAVDPGSAWEKLIERTARGIAWIYGSCLLAALLGTGFGIVSLSMPETERDIETRLTRPSFGKTRTVHLDVAGIDEEELPVTVSVSGQIPSGKELETLFDETFAKVKKSMLGENPSVDAISQNLNFLSDGGQGIRVSWESDCPQIISSTGILKETELPPEGVVVTLRCTLSIGDHVREYILPVHRISPEQTSKVLLQTLSDELTLRNKASRNEENLVLPTSVGETPLIFYARKQGLPWGLLILCVLGGLFRAVSLLEELKERAKDRSEELLMAYPGFVFQLSVVLSCGLTISAAWERVTNNLRRRRELTKEPSCLLTEAERVMTARKTGSLETDALRAFGQRCGHECYQRLAGYLVQNVRLGTGGLQALLSAELGSALAMRRDTALRRGEKMGTKLLLPMFVELAVVIAVLVIPAVLEM